MIQEAEHILYMKENKREGNECMIQDWNNLQRMSRVDIEMD